MRVNDSRASRLHARISTLRDSTSGELRCKVTDLASTNGTQVNGQLITETILNEGDKIAIGDHLFRFDMLDEIDREFQQQIHRLLSHDELTGLLTSKSFFSELRREAARAETESRPFCVLMMDLDHFKGVNDTYGHLVGSQTLEAIGRSLRRRCVPVMLQLVLEEKSSRHSCLMRIMHRDWLPPSECAQRLRSMSFPAVRQDSPEDQTLRITISIGVAAFPDDATDPIQLIELADAALYRAKRSGRNRICAYRHSIAATEGPLPPRRR